MAISNNTAPPSPDTPQLAELWRSAMLDCGATPAEIARVEAGDCILKSHNQEERDDAKDVES